MFPIEDEEDEIESQARAFSSVSVFIGNDFKSFHEGITFSTNTLI
jgi:hypothetical protein